MTTAAATLWELIVTAALGHSPRLFRRVALGGSPVVPVGAVGAHVWLAAAGIVLVALPLALSVVRLVRTLA